MLLGVGLVWHDNCGLAQSSDWPPDGVARAHGSKTAAASVYVVEERMGDSPGGLGIRRKTERVSSRAESY